MTDSARSRRALAEVHWSADAGAVVWVGQRTLHHYWPMLSSYFRDVLLPPQRRSDDDSVSWTWQEAGNARPPTAAELATLRKRLRGDQQSFADNLDRAGRDAETARVLRSHAGVDELGTVMHAVVEALVAKSDAELAACVCRTDAGLRLHSWGAATPAVPTYPDEQSCEVSGTVIAAGRAVAGRDVIVENGDGTVIARTRTGSGGTFVFKQLAPGAYRLRVATKRSAVAGAGLHVVVQHDSISGLELSCDEENAIASGGSSTRAGWWRPAVVAGVILALVAAGWAWYLRPKAPDLRDGAAPHAGAEAAPHDVQSARSPAAVTGTESAVRAEVSRSVPTRADATSSRAPQTSVSVSTPAAASAAEVEREIVVPASPSGTPTAAGAPGSAAQRQGNDPAARSAASAAAPGSSAAKAASSATSANDPASASAASIVPPEASTPSAKPSAARAGRRAPPGTDEAAPKNRPVSADAKQSTASAERAAERTPQQLAERTEAASPDAASTSVTAVAAGAATTDDSRAAELPTGARDPAPRGATARGRATSENREMPNESAAVGIAAASDAASRTRSQVVRLSRSVRLRVGPWTLRLLRDAILPTVPVPVGNADGLADLHAATLAATQARVPPSLRAAAIRCGFTVIVRDGMFAVPLAWSRSDAFSTSRARVEGRRAELSWRATETAHPGVVHLRAGDDALLVEVRREENGDTVLSLADGVEASLQFSFESSAAGSAPRFAWELNPAAATAADAHAVVSETAPLRLEIPLAFAAPLTVRTVRLCDGESGWALTAQLRIAVETAALR